VCTETGCRTSAWAGNRVGKLSEIPVTLKTADEVAEEWCVHAVAAVVRRVRGEIKQPSLVLCESSTSPPIAAIAFRQEFIGREHNRHYARPAHAGSRRGSVGWGCSPASVRSRRLRSSPRSCSLSGSSLQASPFGASGRKWEAHRLG